MTRTEVLEGLQAEGARLAGVMLDLGEEDFRRRTPCVPWTVAELLAHVLVATNRLPAMLRTRWGDAMLLTDVLVTRVVELAVHGLDLAAGLDQEPWTTPEAAGVTERLLLGSQAIGTPATMGWDRLAFIRKATGRVPLTDDEARLMTEHGVRWLTLS